MTDSPRVTAVTIFLDAEPFIGQAIESVLVQTFTNWELLLVDDGSTDGSTSIARDYARIHPDRIRYLEHAAHENRGMSASRNLGLANAAGEYVAFLDADDAWLPTKLEEQVAILDAHPDVAMVFGTEIVWYSWSGRAQDESRDHLWQPTVAMDAVASPPTLVPQFLLYGRVPCPSLIAVRRSAAERCGGFEDSFRGMYEDDVFYAKLCLREPVYVASQTWNRRRQHPGAATSQSDQTGSSRRQRRTYLEWLERYLDEHGERGSEAWQALQEQLLTFRSAHGLPWNRRLTTLLARLASAATRTLRDLGARLGGSSRGTLRAEPNPVHLGLTGAASTTLSWTTHKARAVEVHLGRPDGPLVSRSGPAGSTQVGDWLNNGMVFFLQDVTNGETPPTARTLDRLRISVLA